MYRGDDHFDRSRCPCCGYYTLHGRGQDDICPACFWHDDNATEEFGHHAPERPQGPNGVHLWQARENYLAFGASEERVRAFVRPPYDLEATSTGDD